VTVDLEAVRQRWLQERPAYEELCKRVKSMLEGETRRLGIPCTLQTRTKAVDSFLKKVLRKRYDHPYEEVSDKAGVRVICTYTAALPKMVDIVGSCFSVHDYENKRDALQHDRLGYLGIHFDVSIPTDTSWFSKQIEGLLCEIQIHTRAQNLWADIAHELSYKPSQPAPPEVQRGIYRLTSLIEIFDDEVERARANLLGVPGFQEARMLEQLDAAYYGFTAKPYDRDLSLEVLSSLRLILDPRESEQFGHLIGNFVDCNKNKLESMLRAYSADDRCNPLLFQPEKLLVFFLIEKNSFSLRTVWGEMLPIELLESLATIWGRPI
jgi:ppGpp synthetase/RelA/SpoT-type nucleotidyltranferase